MPRIYERKRMLPPEWWSPELQQYFELWCLDMQQGMRPYTPVTVRTFKRRFILYTRLGWEASPPKALSLTEVFNPTQVYRVLSSYPIESFSNRHNMLYSLVSFARFLVALGLVENSLIDKLRKFRPKRVIPARKTVLKNENQIEALRQAIQTGNYISTYSRILDETIVETIMYTGIRNAELCQLNLEDVDFKENVIHIRLGKGRKDRKVGLSQTLRPILLKYLKERQLKANLEPTAFFINRRGTRIKTADMTRRFMRFSKRMGLSITPHGLRRTFATRHAENGKPLHLIQKALGHTDIRTTQGYLMSDEKAVIDAMKDWD